ncbi:prepilin peptidase [Vibrio mangrovi]|uniref:Prepilin leader peptidase/N-methyltransferase n=1 Tax=Vibrio mangrovi TaxID=474394 RepID=A0A1Y6IYV6_9VIBR|nr:A24 family peptidase [Vibrio mangrovi]MDW6002992.1 A24 family peptidase [Vibrio mangrovi]SMS01233.1 Type 4 prepilin-like proteins leader peptide-processing enzyme [Vibrio mangrovi]
MDAFFTYPWLFPVLVSLFGLIIGSFLNVVIYRLPQMMIAGWKQEIADTFPEYNIPPPPPEENVTLSLPASFCPHCHHPIRPWHNIPLFGWLLLRGKCADCKNRISVQYPLVELLTALTSCTIAIHGGITLYTAALLLFTYVSIAAAFIDLNRMLLPDSLTIPLIWLGLLLSLSHISPVDLQDAVIGAVAGYLSLWSVYWVFKLLTKKEGMGYGDFKYLSALGAWIGWQTLPMVILISSVIGVILGITLLLIKKEGNRTFPFGPSLAIAGWGCLLWGEQIMSWYTSIVLGA